MKAFSRLAVPAISVLVVCVIVDFGARYAYQQGYEAGKKAGWREADKLLQESLHISFFEPKSTDAS